MPVRTSVVVAVGLGAAAYQAWRWRRQQRARHMRNDDIRYTIRQQQEQQQDGGLPAQEAAKASRNGGSQSGLRFLPVAHAEAVAEEPALPTSWDWNWDGRNQDKPSKATRHIFLARHGKYMTEEKDHNLQILNMLGVVQATLLADRVAAMTSMGTKWDTFISSTMPRAAQTAAIVHRGIAEVQWTSDDRLCEGYPALPWPLPPAQADRWTKRRGKIDNRDYPRLEAAFREYFHRASPEQASDTNTLIVCHANVIRYFVCRALQLPPEAWLRFSLPHCSLTHIAVRPDGRVSLVMYGDVVHMGAHWPASVTLS